MRADSDATVTLRLITTNTSTVADLSRIINNSLIPKGLAVKIAVQLLGRLVRLQTFVAGRRRIQACTVGRTLGNASFETSWLDYVLLNKFDLIWFDSKFCITTEMNMYISWLVHWGEACYLQLKVVDCRAGSLSQWNSSVPFWATFFFVFEIKFWRKLWLHIRWVIHVRYTGEKYKWRHLHEDNFRFNGSNFNLFPTLQMLLYILVQLCKTVNIGLDLEIQGGPQKNHLNLNNCSSRTRIWYSLFNATKLFYFSLRTFIYCMLSMTFD